jgi:YegS/Rv2252/BmrU family lipid kinase
LYQTNEFLAHQGWQVTGIEQTHGAGDATTYARRAAAQGYDAVFVAGGDGTLAQVVDGLVGTETVLGVLPTGSGNVFARQLNLPVPGGLHPRPILEAVRLQLEGQPRPIDVGRVSPKGHSGPVRHFLCWCGVGFDAQMSIRVEEDKERKKRLGAGVFLIAGILTLRDFAGTRAVVRVDGHRVSRRMMMLVANNIQLYGIIFKMATTAVLDDGLLDVYCFQGRGTARTLLHAVRLLFSRHIQDPKVDIFRARRIEVSPARPLPVHVDGDYIGYTPVVMEVVPRGLKLLVPPYAPANLFVDGTSMIPPEAPWEWMIRMVRGMETAFRGKSV